MAEPIKLISDAHLDIMLRNGWTPTEVRELIAAYKELKAYVNRRRTPPAERAKKRPKNYQQLSEQEKWAIDKKLGILDWVGRDAQ